MRIVPVYFHPSIPLANVRQAAELLGCQITGTARGELYLEPKTTDPAPAPANVVPFRRR